MKPEEKARQNIDRLLHAVGWKVQDLHKLNLGESLDVPVLKIWFCGLSAFCRPKSCWRHLGLTATPSKQTLGFFNQNLVTEYSHERAVADGVTPDASHKTHFVIVDAVGVFENDKTDSRPLERKRSVPFDKLLLSVALGSRDNDILTSLAARLARLDQEIDEKDRKEIEAAAGGVPLKQVINQLLDAVDPDKQLEQAKEVFETETPTPEQVKMAAKELVEEACAPFDNPQFRNTLIEIKSKSEQIINTVSQDNVTFAGFDEQAKDYFLAFCR